jgi:hypothetical protein
MAGGYLTAEEASIFTAGVSQLATSSEGLHQSSKQLIQVIEMLAANTKGSSSMQEQQGRAIFAVKA